MTDNNQTVASREALEDMVAQADTGGRKPLGAAKQVIFFVALAWALFIIISVLSYLIFRTSNRWVFYRGGDN